MSTKTPENGANGGNMETPFLFLDDVTDMIPTLEIEKNGKHSYDVYGTFRGAEVRLWFHSKKSLLAHWNNIYTLPPEGFFLHCPHMYYLLRYPYVKSKLRHYPKCQEIWWQLGELYNKHKIVACIPMCLEELDGCTIQLELRDATLVKVLAKYTIGTCCSRVSSSWLNDFWRDVVRLEKLTNSIE